MNADVIMARHGVNARKAHAFMAREGIEVRKPVDPVKLLGMTSHEIKAEAITRGFYNVKANIWDHDGDGLVLHEAWQRARREEK